MKTEPKKAEKPVAKSRKKPVAKSQYIVNVKKGNKTLRLTVNDIQKADYHVLNSIAKLANVYYPGFQFLPRAGKISVIISPNSAESKRFRAETEKKVKDSAERQKAGLTEYRKTLRAEKEKIDSFLS